MTHDALRARLYDWKHEGFLRRQLRDVEFFAHWARQTDGPILELGCGTGRVTADLAERGHDVVGLDRDSAMLDRARRRVDALGAEAQHRVRFVEGDMREFDLDGPFPLVCIPYNTFQCLRTLEAQRQCLRTIRRHLTAEGRLCLQLTPFQLVDDPSDWEHRVTDRLDEEGTVVAMYERIRQDDPAQLTHFDQRFQLFRPDGTVETVEDSLTVRTIFRFECRLLLEQCGFELTDL
ncbi:MAG: trans-aconitate 2-methyltransferase, partial [Bradymonadaceae bacterium]